MICRAPTGTTSCSGSANTGQQLTWDSEGRLAAWQDAPTSPTTTAQFLYDDEGQRVAQQVTTSGTTTTTTYVGSLAEYTTTGGATSSTDYLYAAGKLVAEAVTSGGTTTLTYLVTNAQGTPLEALDGNGNVTASRLYTPYGASRYTSGAFPTSYGYTGQRSDAASGLDYYGARYYDPAIGQFTSADTVLDGLSRYGYVGGNPVTASDPSGHQQAINEEAPANEPGRVESPWPTLEDAGPGGAGSNLFNAGAGKVSTTIGLVLVLGAAAIFIKGKIVSSDGSDLIVKSPDGRSATRYSPGDPEYNTWSQAYNDALKDTDVWNARTAPKAGPKPSEPRAPVSEPAGSTPQTQTGGGSVGAPPGGGGGPPSVASPAHPEEDPCTCNPVDLFRSGNAGSPRVDNVRLGKEVTDPSGIIYPGQGVSTFESIGGEGKWWKLPAGTELPDGLQFFNDHDAHWLIQPAHPMTVDEYKDLARQIQGWEKCF